MTIVEFFGPPATGKTFFYNQIKKEFQKQDIFFCSYNDFFFKYAFKEINFNMLDYVTLFYFFFIHKKNTYIPNIKIKLDNSNYIKKTKNKSVSLYFSNFFFINYQNIISKLYIKLKPKNYKLFNFYKKNIIKKNNSNTLKKNYLRWFKKLCVERLLINKYSKDKKYVFFVDEGFYQRSFAFIDNQKTNFKIVNQYFKLIPKVDYLLMSTINAAIFKKRIQQRKKNLKMFQYKNYNEIVYYKKVFKKITKLIKT
tara:strand:+ start:41716 stop:42474 length:759 start_codon:yes stop_codon:yes gene_type:complete